MYILTLQTISFDQSSDRHCGINDYIEEGDIITFKVALGVSPVFNCVAKGESRSRSAVTPSVCLPVRPEILSSQLL